MRSHLCVCVMRASQKDAGQLRLLIRVVSEPGGIHQVNWTFVAGFGAGQIIVLDVCGRVHSKAAIHSWKFLR